MMFLNNSQIVIDGDLHKRIHMNITRLDQTDYLPDNKFFMNVEWPGDWEGRILLAMVNGAAATGRIPVYYEEYLGRLTKLLTENGYMGPKINDGSVNEQQLAGNSWLLRALCDLYEWRGEQHIYNLIKGMCETLILPLRERIADYPVSEQERGLAAGDGRADGWIVCEANGWLCSSDTGCLFIMLDGATHAYSILHNPILKEVIETIISKFTEADLTASSYQTHASLTAARGIMRFYFDTQEEKYINIAKNVFCLYKSKGMTENHANINWFNRPDWTEPCAVIDSYMLACQLFTATKDPSYIADAHNIYYNAILPAQRINGGFGCDNCVGWRGAQALSMIMYDAYWCCTMRGGEGLSKAARYTATQDKNGLYIINYHNAVVITENITLRLETEYPNNGYIRLETLSGNLVCVYMFVPPFAENTAVLVNGKPVNINIENGFVCLPPLSKDNIVEFKFDIPLQTVKCFTPINGTVIKHGTLLLAKQLDDAYISMPDTRGLTRINDVDAVYKDNADNIFKPLSCMTDLTEEEVKRVRMQFVFNAER